MRNERTNRGCWTEVKNGVSPPPKKAGSFIVSEDWTNMILFESSGLLRREGLVLNTRFLKQIWTSAGKMGKYFKRCAAISPWAMFTNSSKDTHLLFFFLMVISLCPGIVHSIMVIVDCLLCWFKLHPSFLRECQKLHSPKVVFPFKGLHLVQLIFLPRWPPLQLSAVGGTSTYKTCPFFRVNVCLRPLRFQKKVGIDCSNFPKLTFQMKRDGCTLFIDIILAIQISNYLFVYIPEYHIAMGGTTPMEKLGWHTSRSFMSSYLKLQNPSNLCHGYYFFYLYWYHCIYICTVMCLYHGYMVSFVWFFSLHRYTQTIIASMHFKSELRKMIADFSCNSKHHPKASKKGQPSTPCEYLLEQQGHKTSSS